MRRTEAPTIVSCSVRIAKPAFGPMASGKRSRYASADGTVDNILRVHSLNPRSLTRSGFTRRWPAMGK